jgi:hypothetical protein
MHTPPCDVVHDARWLRPRQVAVPPAWSAAVSGSGSSCEAVARAATAQQLNRMRPHEPPPGGATALVQWLAAQGFVVGAVAGIPRWHARGQGFKSPQLHPRSKARSGPCRLQIPTLWQQIGSNPCCLGRSGRPAKRQRRPASPPGTGHIRPSAASLAPATKHRIGRGTADRFKLVSDLILIRVLHPGLFLQHRSCDLHNDAPLETATNRSAPMDCGPNVDQTLARVRVRVRSVADACGAPVLRDQDRSAGRARQGRSLRRPSVAVDPPGFSGRASPRTWQRTRCRWRPAR